MSHNIYNLLGSDVQTAYFSNEDHKAVIEFDPEDSAAYVIIDGLHVSGGKVSEVLSRYSIPADGWETKPARP